MNRSAILSVINKTNVDVANSFDDEGKAIELDIKNRLLLCALLGEGTDITAKVLGNYEQLRKCVFES